MARSIDSRPLPAARGLAFGAMAALAAAWLWSRHGEAALHRRTAERLRPLTGRHRT
jgi:hypothetical protein